MHTKKMVGLLRNEVIEMVLGVITTKDLLFHPVCSIEAFGLKKYILLLFKCCDRKKQCLIDIIWK